MNAEGGELAPQLLQVAVLTVQRHLELQTHLVLLRYQLINHMKTLSAGVQDQDQLFFSFFP